MASNSSNARARIVAAASQLAREVGPGNISLDAVAAQAGLSKGGLLYHFPNKNRLLEAIVEYFLGEFEAAMAKRLSDGNSRTAGDALVDLFIEDHRLKEPPPTGLLSALSENPEMLAPVRRHDRKLLDQVKADAKDPVLASIVLLTIQGLRSAQLLSTSILTEQEFDAVTQRLKQMIASEPAA